MTARDLQQFPVAQVRIEPQMHRANADKPNRDNRTAIAYTVSACNVYRHYSGLKLCCLHGTVQGRRHFSKSDIANSGHHIGSNGIPYNMAAIRKNSSRCKDTDEMKNNRSQETQTLRACCSKAEPTISVPPQTPSRGRAAPKFNQLETVTTFTYERSLVRIDACNFEFSW